MTFNFLLYFQPMKTIIKTAGLFYFVILFYIFFLARRRPHPTLFLHREPVNFIPLIYKLNTISDYHTLRPLDKWIFITDLFGNIALFMPLPFFLVFIFHVNSLRKTIRIAIIISVCIELIQFIFSIGVADIDDVILNTLGAIIGGVILKLLKKRWPRVYYTLAN
jgi:glycopeptide antibiotics resistance protein